MNRNIRLTVKESYYSIIIQLQIIILIIISNNIYFSLICNSKFNLSLLNNQNFVTDFVKICLEKKHEESSVRNHVHYYIRLKVSKHELNNLFFICISIRNFNIYYIILFAVCQLKLISNNLIKFKLVIAILRQVCIIQLR